MTDHAIEPREIRQRLTGGLRFRMLSLQRAAKRQGYVITSLDSTPGMREVRIESLDRSVLIRVWEAPAAWFGEVERIEEVTLISGRERVRSQHRRPWHSTILRDEQGSASLAPLAAFKALGHYLEDNPRKALPTGEPVAIHAGERYG